MTRSQLIDAIALRLGLDRPAAEAVVHTIFDTMASALERGDGIELRGFGSFGVRGAAAYRGRNPRSGETVDVDSKKVPWFKVGRPFRARIEGSVGAGEEAREGEDEEESRATDLPAAPSRALAVSAPPVAARPLAPVIVPSASTSASTASSTAPSTAQANGTSGGPAAGAAEPLAARRRAG